MDGTRTVDGSDAGASGDAAGLPPNPAPDGALVISAALSLSETTVHPGDTVTGTVTFKNSGTADVAVQGFAIAARPPGGTHSGGPFDDFTPETPSKTLVPWASVTVTATRTFAASDPIGTWDVYPTWEDGADAWHDGPDSALTLTASTNDGGQGSGGDSGALGGLSPQQFVEAMSPGWNLGNTFDADPTETSWGNPETTQAMVQTVQAAGFKTMRIPVTWTHHIGAGPAYAIDPAWMAKVQQVATWANQAGMYAIVNTHHDADGQWILFNDPGSNTLSPAKQAQIAAEISAVWTQIATAFQSYDAHLIFECFNEPHGDVNGYSGGDAASRGVLNSYLVACMKAIRSTGGNNATRYVMVQGIGAQAVQASIQAVVIPGNDPNVLFSVHSYFPWSFSGGGGTTTWGAAASDYTDMSSSLQGIRSWLPPTQGIVMGEWGDVGADDLNSRVAHAAAYAQDITVAGMAPIWWDDGGMYVLLNRNSNPPSWQYPTILSAIMSGYRAGAAPGAMYAVHP